MDSPEFKLLASDPNARARLITIRNAVTPLLATNYLSHFTDHSVEHSDRLSNLVDELANSLGQSKLLSSREAAILYVACYFHDAGMQHERADETMVVGAVLKAEPYRGQPWSSLTRATQQEIVRANHHRISAQLVRDAVRSVDQALGVQLKDGDAPGIISALCLAHCLPTDQNEYQATIADQGGVRVGLLSAILRIADILDESRRRSQLHLEVTRELPLQSRLHWWRHYYVSDITVESRAITVWFDFPVDRRAQYKELFEPLQMPWIEAEIGRHSCVLAENGLAWHLEARDTPAAQCVARTMDDELERFAVEEAVKRRSEQLRQDRIATIKQLRVARPTIERQFTALRDSKRVPDEQLEEAVVLAEHLAAIGGTRDGCMSLLGALHQLKSRVSDGMRLKVALRVGELMVEDGLSSMALRHLAEFVPHFIKLPIGDPIKLRYLRVWAKVLRDNCNYKEAITAFEELANATKGTPERAIAEAEIAEMHLLQGEMAKLRLQGEKC